MTDLMMWNLIVGFALPHLIAVVNQPTWSKRFRVATTVVISMVFGGITTYFNGDLSDTSTLVSSILIVLVAAISFYKNLWKQTGIPQAIESTTSGSRNGRLPQ